MLLSFDRDPGPPDDSPGNTGSGSLGLAPAAYLAPIVLWSAHVALWQIHDLASHPWWTITCLAVGFVAFAVTMVRFESRIKMAHLIIFAALLRIPLLPLPPTLSDDALRYVWDGRVVSAGFNPYLTAPEHESLAELRDERWRIMPHKEVPTVYPPLALGLFALGALAPDPVLGIKILLVFIDLLACALLFALARRIGAPPGRAAWYAWNPLVVLEVAGQGHIDALMVACMIAAVLCIGAKRPIAAGMATVGGIAAKLVPLVLILVWARTHLVPRVEAGGERGRALQYLMAVAVFSMLIFLPVAVSTGLPPGLVTYGVSWEFNGPLYEPLWRAVDYLDPIDEIKGGIDRLKGRLGDTTGHDFWNRFYPFVYPQLLAKLLLAAGFGLAWLWYLIRARSAGTVAGQVLGAVILCTATVYPWYLLWVLPWAALYRHRAWLTVSGLALLSYLPQHDPHLELFPWVWGCIWIPFFILLCLHRNDWLPQHDRPSPQTPQPTVDPS